jgi:hypothetical protein
LEIDDSARKLRRHLRVDLSTIDECSVDLLRKLDHTAPR